MDPGETTNSQQKLWPHQILCTQVGEENNQVTGVTRASEGSWLSSDQEQDSRDRGPLGRMGRA